MIRLKLLIPLLIPAFALTLPAQPVAASTNNSDRIVVMISVDGLAGFYLDDPKAVMPNIRALAAGGARASAMKASSPSVTWPNHTTLVTGVYPGRHGVVGNNFYDRLTKQDTRLIQDPIFDKDQIVKVPTIYDVAKSNGLKTAAIRWPATRNAKTLDWTIPDMREGQLLEKYSTLSVFESCEKEGIFWRGTNASTVGKKPANLSPDGICASTFNLILKEHRPQLALLHMAYVDHMEHLNGPRSPEAYAAIKDADAQVGNVWKELERDFPGKATLIVVSDHGFSSIKHIILPNVILRDAKLIEVKGKKIIDGSVRIVVQGGSAMVYVTDENNRLGIINRLEKAFRHVKGVEKVVGPDHLQDYGMADPKIDPHSPDMMLFAKDGYAFGDTAAGELPFAEKPERKGSHGHNPALPNLHATFVAWGVGIKPGSRLGEIENISVAPTIAKLLNISLPDTDGKPLTAILSE